MTASEHRLEHIRLHRALDELVACYLSQQTESRTSIHDEIYALMKWNYAMMSDAPAVPEPATSTADSGPGPGKASLKATETQTQKRK